jgi:putative membrane protein
MTGAGATGGMSTSTRLAVDRTRLAYERTLMANIRTSTALISFGFTIYKISSELRRPEATKHLLGASHFGLIMIVTGVMYLVLTSMEHVRQMKTLKAQYGTLMHMLPMVLAGLISVLGILGLFVVIFRQ